MPTPRKCEVFLVDPNAILRGKWVVGDAACSLDKGIAFPFSLMGVDVWGREVHETGLHIESGDRDAVCKPVEGRVSPVPWADDGTSQSLLSMYHRDGEPFFGDPRHALARQVRTLDGQGYEAQVALELEFYLLERRAGKPAAAASSRGDGAPHSQNMYGVDDLNRYGPFLDAVLAAADVQELPVSSCVSEASPGQFEINLNHRDPISAADDAVLLRRLIRALAHKAGLEASFMAKPFAELPGNGMHIHVSFMKDATPVFGAEQSGDAALAHAIEGCLSTIEEAQLGFVHSFNGFRRMQPGSYAPNSLTWGRDNRSVAIRIPTATGPNSRFEHRLAGADANPHIVTALTLAGAARGLAAQKEPGPETTANAYTDASCILLNADMSTAIDHFADSSFAEDALGAELHQNFACLKRAELAAFGAYICDLEHQTFL
ncbi:MAG: glutamine synthetase family protein [Pseudomonadota bacterium]